MTRPIGLGLAYARYGVELLERVAADLDGKDRERSASADSRGYSAGYHAGKAETLDAVARGLRQQADRIRHDPSLALNPPELRLL
jgi:hypothetical protein